VRVTKDITSQIFKPMNEILVEMNPLLANSLEPSLDDILLGYASVFPLFKTDYLINKLYKMTIRFQTSDYFFVEMRENAALKSIQKKNEKKRADNAEKAVKSYAPAFHKFNSSPTCLDQDSDGKRIRETINLSKDRNISRHFK